MTQAAVPVNFGHHSNINNKGRENIKLELILCLGITPVRGLGKHLWSWGSVLGWACARQVALSVAILLIQDSDLLSLSSITILLSPFLFWPRSYF